MSPAGDKTVTCRDCGNSFPFSAGEQQFYAERGLHEPSRCPDCRAARKAGRDTGGGSSGSYQSGSRSSSEGYRTSSRSSGSSDRSSSSRQLYSAECADCGKPTQVPFEPTQGRPVYCRDCYERRRGQR